MANNKFYGYTPDPSKEIEGNRLDKLNPYEFRKGMDYELTSIGIDRLREATIEQREKATENVLKNLQEHGGYYSGLIQFEGGMNQGSKITETNFKKWLENYMPGGAGTGMVEVDQEIKTDKMTELKEAIKAEIKNILSEVKGKEAEKINKADAKKEKEEKTAPISTAKGKAKKLAALEKEASKLDVERTKLKDSQKAPLAKYKDGKMSSSEYTIATKDSVKRIKEIIARLKEIENEKEEITLAEKMGRREVAKTMMEKDTHMEILNIMKEAGVNLREGANGIKMYYEIAKTAYQEGFMAGVNKN
jgi:hypothetical protein